jgi:polycystin 1L2
VEEDDGMVERVLPVAGLADLTAFNHLFGASVRKKLTNDHLWFSVVSRPTKSSFTRVQRVSCCVSLLFLTMITNCMFFKADDNVQNVSTLQVGPFAFTLHQLFISIVTTAIVFPPSMFIVTVFRKARPKNNGIMQMNQQLSQKSKKFRWRKVNGGSSLWNNVEQTKMQKFKDSMRNILTFHQKSKYETEGGAGGDDGLTKKKKKKGWSLPWWTIYIAWTSKFASNLQND